MEKYDPLEAPDAEEWLEADEIERRLLVEEYHQRARIELPRATVHATFHVVVENQIAEPISEVVAVLNRLMNEGLDRHDAIHAIGSVLVEHMFGAVKDPAASDLNADYLRDLEDLTAKKWLASADER
jgi:hypothetical protein